MTDASEAGDGSFAHGPGATPGLRSLRSVEQLAAAGLISAKSAAETRRVANRYAVAITPTMARLVDAANPSDPVGLQFLPDLRELTTTPDESPDPISDHAHSPIRGVVHRYRDRALIKLLHVCPVYCRFCFRREMVGPDGDGALSPAEFAAALAYIEAHPEIFEVILTGGDPFMISARRAKEIGEALAKINHVQVVRWHSRVPIVDPERVTPQFVAALRISGKATYVGIHANHAREFTEPAREALARLADAGISLVSQTVLLRGVNDKAEALEELMRAFLANRVKPYYLHHMDLAPGAGHFRVSIEHGQELMRRLRGRLSGLAQPTYVIDIPGGYGKSPIGPSYLSFDADGARLIVDPDGDVHAYPSSGSPPPS